MEPEYKEIINYISNKPFDTGVVLVGIGSFGVVIYTGYKIIQLNMLEKKSKLENKVKGDEK